MVEQVRNSLVVLHQAVEQMGVRDERGHLQQPIHEGLGP